MKAALVFSLPEEEHEHLRAVLAPELAMSLRAVADAIRDRLKHGTPGKVEVKTLEHLRTLIDFEALERSGS